MDIKWRLFGRTGWIHDVSDVWMNRWVLKKFSKDVFDGFVEYVKNIKQKLQHMYVCVPHVRKSTTHRDRNLLGEPVHHVQVSLLIFLGDTDTPFTLGTRA